MTKIVSVHSFRGGTGKSNSSANIAAKLAASGKRVGVVDTDGWVSITGRLKDIIIRKGENISAKEIEDLGVHLLDARSFLDDHLATSGCMTGKKFPIDADYLAHGVQIAKESARLDIGQGCVVRKGTVLAVEAFEGTDAMLRRAGEFKSDEALFVKTVKARQDYRFDVPCFGLKTLETMREAGLTAAALETHRVILLDKPAVLAQAKSWGIHLLGFE